MLSKQTEKQKTEIDQQFQLYDIKRDGTLSRAEVEVLLSDLCKKIGTPNLDSFEHQKLFLVLDNDNNDQINVGKLHKNIELLKNIIKNKNKTKCLNQAREAFNLFNLQPTDRLDKSQIKILVNIICNGIAYRELLPGQAKILMKIMDVNRDGVISFNEFADNYDKIDQYLQSINSSQKTNLQMNESFPSPKVNFMREIPSTDEKSKEDCSKTDYLGVNILKIHNTAKLRKEKEKKEKSKFLESMKQQYDYDANDQIRTINKPNNVTAENITNNKDLDSKFDVSPKNARISKILKKIPGSPEILRDSLVKRYEENQIIKGEGSLSSLLKCITTLQQYSSTNNNVGYILPCAGQKNDSLDLIDGIHYNPRVSMAQLKDRVMTKQKNINLSLMQLKKVKGSNDFSQIIDIDRIEYQNKFTQLDSKTKLSTLNSLGLSQQNLLVNNILDQHNKFESIFKSFLNVVEDITQEFIDKNKDEANFNDLTTKFLFYTKNMNENISTHKLKKRLLLKPQQDLPQNHMRGSSVKIGNYYKKPLNHLDNNNQCKSHDKILRKKKVGSLNDINETEVCLSPNTKSRLHAVISSMEDLPDRNFQIKAGLGQAHLSGNSTTSKHSTSGEFQTFKNHPEQPQILFSNNSSSPVRISNQSCPIQIKSSNQVVNQQRCKISGFHKNKK